MSDERGVAPGGDGDGLTVRQARATDREAVVAFTEDTWPERDGDYIPRVFDEWIETDGPAQRTFVLDAGDDVAGICQGVLLSEHEAWAQGMRVNPDYRGDGASALLTEAVFDWARERGASVCRNMVFSWNAAGLGQSRAMGFDPRAEFRWAEPTPDADAGHPTTSDLRVVEDPDAAWTAWTRSDGREELAGLTLAEEESWALSELTRERLGRAAEETTVLAVVGDSGARAMTFRSRTFELTDDEFDRGAEYGVGVWADTAAARALFAAVARDAASVDAGRARVLIPETTRHVSDAAYARVGFSDEPDFVLEKDLTGE